MRYRFRAFGSAPRLSEPAAPFAPSEPSSYERSKATSFHGLQKHNHLLFTP